MESPSMTSAVGQHLKDRFAAAPGEAWQMIKGKIAQGATEISNALNSQANAYSPYTADTAAYRAQFANRGQDRTAER